MSDPLNVTHPVVQHNAESKPVLPKVPLLTKRPSFLQDVRGTKKLKESGIGNISKRDRASMSSQLDSIPTIDASELRDPDWEEKNRASAIEKAMISANLADVSKDDKKKHHINWLAMDVRDKELQLLEKSAAKKSNQRSKTLKYGW